ncbi:hypothetical protein [Streptomyces subrutilus]|uniref:Uncharacterized protein n=1 Tax=Streptomyces subrutilus TaxID=36818 RepID=A0A1E5PVM8_9ACTN|nr:hypothetical protein [Streptomyces subrutilus]OEJ33510.1 hypothetical protein BGK67_21190 [Streptomyces subrutilus]
MRDRAAARVMERLRAVEWDGEWDDLLSRVMSRRLLMREYLRRAGLWARACSAEAGWPFFDVVEYLDPAFPAVPQEDAAQLRELLCGSIVVSPVNRTCTGAMRLAEFRARRPDALPDLPDLYEPLLLFYERGGAFLLDHAGFLDLAGVLVRPGTLAGRAAGPPLGSLDRALLDAVDAIGRITYYRAADRHGPALRRRVVRGVPYDEAFGGDGLGWGPAGLPLPASPELAAEFGVVWLDEVEAAALVWAALADGGQPGAG